MPKMDKEKDLRYAKTEKKILRAIPQIIRRINNRLFITNTSISKEAGITTRSVTRHYKNANELSNHYEQKIRLDVSNMVSKYYSKETPRSEYKQILEKYISDLLRYIMHNPEYFLIEDALASNKIWQLVMDTSRPLIERCWGTYDYVTESKLFKVYSSNAINFLRDWAKKQFSKNYYDTYSKLISNMAITAPYMFKWAVMEYLPP